MVYCNMAPEIVLPAEWEPVDDYSSHRPMLYLALEKVPRGTVCEIGCGIGSTVLLHDYCTRRLRRCFGFETSFSWWERFKDFAIFWPMKYTELYYKAPYIKPDILFIDSAPGEERSDLIKQWSKDSHVIILHDTEPGAEYVYGMSEVLNTFKYRVDLHIPGSPSTTAVSNYIDLNEWRGITIGNYQIT